MQEAGLWTRRVIALLVLLYVGYQVYKGALEPQDIKEMALLVLGFYFGSSKENT